jgi:S-(hydroxymethyl)mycothiol dehydrogenase
VCHTDLHYREGAINDEFPFLLGHEASGKVAAVGPDVTNVAPGDFVVLAWRAPCGQCRSCRRGRPWYCFDSRNASQKMTLEDGTPLSAAIGIGAFAEVCLVAAGQAVKVDPAARPAPAGLVGCGIMAGYGAIVNTARVERGDTVAVFGCGGVGNAAVHAAALAGARKVIAVDIDQRKLELARQFGATDTVDSSQRNPVDAIRELTGGFGADVTVEAVGHPDVFKQAFHARDHAGTLVRMLDFYGRGGSLRPAWYGDCLPTRDFPILIDLYLRGRYDLDRFVSETIALDQVEEAFAKMQRNEVLRSVVVFPDA